MSETTLRNCPPGLFIFDGDCLGFKSEYHTTKSDGFCQTDAYVVASGEYFWGGVSDHEKRERLLVQPVDIDIAEAALVPRIIV